LNLGYLKSKGFILSLLIILITVILSFVINSPYLTLSFLISDIFIIMAVGWDFSSGTTNYINFGISFFFGIGALFTGFFYYSFHLTIPLLITQAFLISSFSGFLITIVTLKVRGVFFTLLSLLLPLIGTDFILAFWTVLKMPTIGYYGLPSLSNSLQISLIYISIFLIVIITLIYALYSGHIGLILKGIGDDEEAMNAQGINTFWYKVLIFSISMGIVGIAGSLYAFSTSFAGIDTFGLEFLLFPMIIAIFGGKGKILGSIPAGYIIIILSQYLQLYVGQLTLISFAALAIILFLFFPKGISRWFS